MQIVRTILWVLLLVAFVGFTFGNMDKDAEVRIWFGYVWNTKIPAVVVLSFLLGMIPTWLLHRGTKWRLTRRIKTLENAVQATAVTAPIASDTAPATAPSAKVAEPSSPFDAEPNTAGSTPKL
ncbi:hypothetical protein GCM10023115_14990 [Pontixanthobacter gangjinensis]|uniref:DUF1049 domain-containing protein n=1 Tax=Pontixanthobacter gangjinensis TaxID=1028742 RepID=A0A6I4SM42_9SPHN|nr:LapA family protein [Pontixanthobacter gangjinensis]MXO56744.1 DUF1049 domain-containing protein [Pontixanthobacter gangjinensis]